MTRALFPFVFRLMLILTAALVVGRAVGAARSPSLLEQASSNPDGTPCAQPCLFGIHPGETSGEEVMRLLETHPLTYNAERTADEVLRLSDSEYYVFYHVTPRGVVESIGMTATLEGMLEGHMRGRPAALSMESITLGDYMLTFGVTDIVFMDSVYLVFPDSDTGTLAVTTRPDDLIQPIDTDIPVTALIVSMIPPCRVQQFGAGGKWTGFTTLERYADRRAALRITPSRFQMPNVRACR